MLNFETDLFSVRRNNSGSGNPYDPESLLTGEEVSQGLTYNNSSRVWHNVAARDMAELGHLPTDAILGCAPRARKGDNLIHPDNPILKQRALADGTGGITWNLLAVFQDTSGVEPWVVISVQWYGARVLHGRYIDIPMMRPYGQGFTFATYRLATPRWSESESTPNVNTVVPANVRAYCEALYRPGVYPSPVSR